MNNSILFNSQNSLKINTGRLDKLKDYSNDILSKTNLKYNYPKFEPKYEKVILSRTFT